MQNREKQIEEMTRDLCECYNCDGTCYQDDKPCDFKCDEYTNAQYLYEKGYRKASDLAEEIFAEMREEIVRYLMLNENIAIKCKEENGECNAEYWKGKLSAFKQIQGFIDTELKKKYIGKDTNVTTKTEEVE